MVFNAFSFVALFLTTFSFSSASVLPHNSSTISPKGAISQLYPVKGSGVLKVPVAKKDPAGWVGKRWEDGLEKRQDFEDLLNVYNGYLITAEIGTPAQTVQVQIDTGSYELWVDPLCSNANSPSYCAQFNVYDPKNSSTTSDKGESFDFLYGTGEARGEYVIDDVMIGSGAIPQTQFGWATWSTFVNTGIMGIGLGYQWNLDYYGPIDQLYVNGVTNSRAFSLDLASIDDADGSVIFGGIDTKKYIGSLYKSPMISAGNSPDGEWRYWIYMTYVGVTMPGATTSIQLTTTTYNQGMFPDSGATLSHFPPKLFNVMIAHFPSAVQQSSGSWTVDCALRNQAGTIDFGFGTKMIHVNFYDWLWEAGGLCYFGAQPDENTFSLGDTFMRSAYLVYDQDNFNIHLAQAENCGTNIVPIGSGVDAVPSIVGGCTASSSTSAVASSTKASSVVSTGVSSIKTTSSSKVSSTSNVSTTSSSSVKTPSSSSSIETTSSSKVSSTSNVSTKSGSSVKISSSSSSIKTTSSSLLSSSKTTSSVSSSKSSSVASSSKTSSSSSSVKTASSTSSSKSSTLSSTSTKTSSSSSSVKPLSTTSSSKSSSVSSSVETSSVQTSASSSKSTVTSKTSSISSSVKTSSVSTSTSKTTSSSKLSSTSRVSTGNVAIVSQTTSSQVTVYVTVTASATHGTCTSIGQKF